MTGRKPHTACHAQSLKFVIARVIVSRPYKIPDPLVFLRIPHRKKETELLGSFHLGLGGDTALGVGDLDTESLGLGEDVDALAGGDSVGNPTSLLVLVSMGSIVG
jgi:hypothetical protein